MPFVGECRDIRDKLYRSDSESRYRVKLQPGTFELWLSWWILFLSQCSILKFQVSYCTFWEHISCHDRKWFAAPTHQTVETEVVFFSFHILQKNRITVEKQISHKTRTLDIYVWKRKKWGWVLDTDRDWWLALWNVWSGEMEWNPCFLCYEANWGSPFLFRASVPQTNQLVFVPTLVTFWMVKRRKTPSTSKEGKDQVLARLFPLHFFFFI